jgi:hypothetical protein
MHNKIFVGILIIIALGIIGGGVWLAKNKISQRTQNSAVAQLQRERDEARWLETAKEINEWLWTQKDEYYLMVAQSSCSGAKACALDLEETTAGDKRGIVLHEGYQNTIPAIWAEFKQFERTGEEVTKERAKAMLSALYYDVVISDYYQLQSDELSCGLIRELAKSEQLEPEVREQAQAVCVSAGEELMSEKNCESADGNVECVYQSYKAGETINKVGLEARWKAMQTEEIRSTLETALIAGLLAVAP